MPIIAKFFMILPDRSEKLNGIPVVYDLILPPNSIDQRNISPIFKEDIDSTIEVLKGNIMDLFS